MSKARRTLIFGGTFDPPHVAHARLPPLAAAQLRCGEILYVPAAINPLKTQEPPTAKEHRLAMLLLAIADVANARVSSIELEREGASYTVDTLRALHQQESQRKSEFFLLIGADQALDFHQWREWREILKLATPAVLLRPPWDKGSFAQALGEIHNQTEADQWRRWTLSRLPRLDVSATVIRDRLRREDYAALDGVIAPSVLDYIRANHLYRRA